MSESVDYYKVLGVAATSTASDIKAAYRAAAKRAHPDAGGTAKAMELVNEAYAVLSAQESRRQYDAVRARPAPAYHHPRQATPPRPPTQSRPTSGRQPAHRPKRYSGYTTATVHHPANLSFARNSAWRIIAYNAQAAFLVGLIVPFLYDHTADAASRTILALVAFAPLYGLAIGIVFLFAPGPRIALAYIGAGRRPRGWDALGLLAIVVAAVPMAEFWLVGFAAGVVK